jgi:hypothetical protein
VARIKVNFFFTGTGDQGWTEEFWRSGDDVRAILAGPALALATERRKCLPTNYQLSYMRASKDDPPRDADFSAPFGSGDGQLPIPAGSTTEPPNVAVNLRVWATPAHWRSYLVRGLLRGTISASNGFVATSPGGAAIITYGNYLASQGNGWQIKTQTRAAPIQVPAITMLGSRRLVITLAGAVNPFAVGDQVVLKNAEGIYPVNHQWRVAAVAGQTITTQRQIRNLVGEYEPNTGFAIPVVYGLIGMDLAKPLRGTSRNTGRPSYVPAGKQRVQGP